MKRIRSTLRNLLPFIPQSARLFLVGYMVATSMLTILDVAAMALLALIITPLVNSQPIVIPLLGEMPLEAAPWLVLVACALIILKSALALLIHWLATRRFARYEFEIGARLFNAYIHSTWEQRSKRSVAEITRIADGGISSAISGFLLPLATLPQSVVTIVLIVTVLAVAQPLTAAVALTYLVLAALVINQVVTRHTLIAAEANLTHSYRVARLMTEMVDALKELTLRNRLGQVAGIVQDTRRKAVRARANASFLSVVPRYSYEAALIGGFVVVGLAAYLTSDLASAVGAVALFAVTGLRIVPALVAVQGSFVDANHNLPTVEYVIEDLQGGELNSADDDGGIDLEALSEHPRTLSLSDVVFTYPRSSEPVIRGLDLDIPLGTSLGVVGPSGAGKSTLIDLLLGLSQPSAGQITIDGTPLRNVIRAWRGRVGYVPQRVALFDGSIAQNVALTWDDDIDIDRLERALDRAQLSSLVSSREGGIHARIGERGVSLSGGQQQRLGIARALYSDPLVLVLDEATSSLDTKTEDDVTQSVRALRGEITLIAVAHRISTIKDFDRIAYVEGGKVLGIDSFDALARTLPQFGLQVQLAGLGAALLEPDHEAITP